MRQIIFISFMLAFLALSPVAHADSLISSDSRIKTLVYNPNDVYTVTTYYGYQSNIEFGLREEIQTISVGDRFGWQIIPAGRRLFIRALDDNLRTNMTIITNKHSYQFDLVAAPADSSKTVTYVMRFFYPEEEEQKSPLPLVDSQAIAQAIPQPQSAQAYNYNYTFSGSDAAAPVKVYDDGSSTYFKFSGAQPAIFYAPKASGELVQLSFETKGEYNIVPLVANMIVVKRGEESVTVYNEAFASAKR